MSEKGKCFICGKESYVQKEESRFLKTYDCPNCGVYQLHIDENQFDFNINHLASYLYYHKYNNKDYRYNTILDKEECDRYKKEFDSGHNLCGRPVHMNSEMVEIWYPKLFSERIDYILMFLGNKMEHIGKPSIYGLQELVSLFFVDRYDIENDRLTEYKKRGSAEYYDEVIYMLKVLEEQAYVNYSTIKLDEISFEIQINPEGYRRIDELQKNNSKGKNAFVAMKFGDDTIPLRKAIRQGIKEAGFNAFFIDEKQHNDFITIELLKEIRDSKFVVVDLTHLNNGAYFEEGYAMGLGKTTIQLCKRDTKLHFDIAQKNTIFWDKEDDIIELLANRIRATVD